MKATVNAKALNQANQGNGLATERKFRVKVEMETDEGWQEMCLIESDDGDRVTMSSERGIEEIFTERAYREFRPTGSVIAIKVGPRHLLDGTMERILDEDR